MAMKGKMRSEGGGRRRIRSKDDGSDASDDDYIIEDDGETEESDEYCPSLSEEELDDDLAEDVKRQKGRVTGRLKRRNAFPTKSRSRFGKASKQRKVSSEEDSDKDFVIDDDVDDVDDVEDGKGWVTGFPKRKRNGVQKAGKRKKASSTEEEDDEVEDSYDDDDDYNEKEDDEDLQKRFLSKNQDGVQRAVRNKKSANTKDNNDDYKAEDNIDGDEDEDDLQRRCPSRRQNGVQKVAKRKKVSYAGEKGINYKSVEGEYDRDDGYNDSEYEKDPRDGCSSKKQNGVGRAFNKNKASYTDENDDDDYESEDDKCEGDDDYNDNEVEKNFRNGCPSRKQHWSRRALKKKMDSDTEESDDDYQIEDDECDEDDEFKDNGDKKNMWNECPPRKQIEVRKALKKQKASYTEENDNDYEVEDDECSDDDDYDIEGEEDEDNDGEDEDFSPNEIDFDTEDEFAAVKKARKVHKRIISSGRKKKSNSRAPNMSKRKNTAKRCGLKRKSSSDCGKQATKGKSQVKETNETSSSRKRRRLLVDSDSDFVDTEALLLDQGHTISEEEREQVREANKICGLDVTFRNSSSKKRLGEDENLHQVRKHKARKGKNKVEDLKNEVAKQVCGICFSEEGKRTVRGTLDCCSHYFCFNCIMEWSKVESRCPLCKQRFATISKPARSDTVFDLRTTVIPIPERDQVYQPSEEELRAYLDPYENVICTECHHGGDDANMLLCDLCDSPAHTYCVGLSEVPEGNWYCEGCRPTALGPSNPQTPNITRDRRTTNDLSARSSSHSRNTREAIDLNRVYEPETPLAEGIGTSSSLGAVDMDIRGGSWIPGLGVQTVRERRRRHQHIAQFGVRTDANFRLGTEVEWGRTRRLDSQNAFRPETSSFRGTFSHGMLHGNFVSPAPSVHLFPATPSHPRAHRVWGQNLTGINGSVDGSGSPQASLAAITSRDSWPFHGRSPMR